MRRQRMGVRPPYHPFNVELRRVLFCRRLAAEASPQAMRRLIELMHAEDERVSYMATVAVLDRSGVKPIDYDPAQDVTPPSWDPGALTDEERENLKAYLVKMVRKAKP